MSGQRKYSMELRERATRMALEARADPSRRKGAIKRIGGQLGINPEALRTWCAPWSRAGAMSVARSVIKRPVSGRWKLKTVSYGGPTKF